MKRLSCSRAADMEKSEFKSSPRELSQQKFHGWKKSHFNPTMGGYINKETWTHFLQIEQDPDDKIHTQVLAEKLELTYQHQPA